jgi:hypothetical protein
MELGLRVRVTVTGGNVVAIFILRQVHRTIFILVRVKVRDKGYEHERGSGVGIRN